MEQERQRALEATRRLQAEQEAENARVVKEAADMAELFRRE
jgi:hypothetical protein